MSCLSQQAIVPPLASAQMESGRTQACKHSYLNSQKLSQEAKVFAKNIAKLFLEKSRLMSWALGSNPRATKTSFRSRYSGVGLQLVCVKDTVLCIKYVWHTVMSYCTLVEQGAEIYHLDSCFISVVVVGKQYV